MFRHIHKNIAIYCLIGIVTLILACGGSSSGGGDDGGGGGGGGGFSGSDVALFANTSYVDYSTGSSASEASNLEAWLRAQGHTVTPFTGITATDINAAVNGKAVLAIPQNEVRSLEWDLDGAAHTAISDFVSGGGTLITFATLSGEINLVNAVFGYTMSGDSINTNVYSGSLTRNAANAAGSPFEDCGPATLAVYSELWAVDSATLPAGAKVIYEDASGNGVVVLIPYGSGNIVLFGWDLLSAKPIGNADGGWWNVMYRAARLNESLPKVGVVYATFFPSAYVDAKAKLDATCQFSSVTLINAKSATPTLATLQEYDSILVIGQAPFYSSTTLGDVVADYVDGGGGVVLSHFTYMDAISGLGGRFLSDNYYAIPNGVGNISSVRKTGEFNFTSHPLLAGVKNFDGGDLSYKPDTSAVVSGVGATRLADWSDGTTPLVVTRSVNGMRRADLGFFPLSSDGWAGSWVSTTDGDKMMANALTWVANVPEPSYKTENSSDTPVDFPDLVLDATSTITVSGGPMSISKVKVTLNITHAVAADLIISLEAPDGTYIALSTLSGVIGSDYTNTVFDDAAPTSVFLGSAPFTGSYIPEQPLSDLIGKGANGDWILHISDIIPGIAGGTLNSWSISIR